MLFLFAVLSFCHASINEDLQKVLLPIMQKGNSEEGFNVSLSISVVHDSLTNGAVNMVLGYSDIVAKTPLTTKSLFPVGSITKSITATGILEFVEAGVIKLDDQVHEIIDPLLKRDNGTSMLEIWNGDKTVLEITVHQLLQMRAGLNDYIGKDMKEWTWSHPNEDFSPYDLLWTLNKTWLCKPGTCGAYTTTGFNILGLVLASISNATHWYDYNQHDILRTSDFTEMLFALKGPCTQYLPEMVHQYHFGLKWKPMPTIVFDDVIKYSCLNAWTGGNLAGSAHGVAKFYHDLFNKKIIQNPEIMTEYVPFTAGWMPNMPYGLGIMPFDFNKKNGQEVNKTAYWYLQGHGGEDWGSSGMAGHNPFFNYGMAVHLNSEFGMNCKRLNPADNLAASLNLLCELNKALITFFGKGKYPAVPEKCPHRASDLLPGPPKHPKIMEWIEKLEEMLEKDGIKNPFVHCEWPQ